MSTQRARCCHSWRHLLFSQRGSYSVERLFAFEEYRKSKSLWRALAVCLLFSLPALAVSILIELIPLQNPFDGAQANYGAWTRLFFIMFVCCAAIYVTIDQLVPELKLSHTRIVAGSIATASCYLAIMGSIGSWWVYPIPFGLVFGVLPFSQLSLFFFLAAVGYKRLQSDIALRRQLVRQIEMTFVQGVIAVVYPLFSAIYFSLPPELKPFFVIVLPIIKFSMQQFIAWFANDMVDYQPGIVVFCVKVFNSLYASKSMQNAGRSSQLTSFVVIGFDLIDFALGMRGLHREMSRVDRWHQRLEAQQTAVSGVNQIKQPLLSVVMKLCEQPGVISAVVHRGAPLIRLESSVRHSLTGDKLVKIERISHNEYKRDRKRSLGSHLPALTWIVPTQSNQILPATEEERGPTIYTKQPTHAKAKQSSCCCQELILRERHDFVHTVLKLLFECEYYLLAEYVECVVPMMYTIYVAFVFQLPSAEYYPETKGLDSYRSRAMMLNLLLYAGLEVVTFLLLHFTIKWRCGVSPTHLLAFVLENQAIEFQGRIFLWYIFLLEFTLIHFGTTRSICIALDIMVTRIVFEIVGVDFSLRFGWM